MARDPSREQAIVKRALAKGYLSGEALREALLLRSQLAQAGRPADLLAILRARFLRPEHAAALGLGPRRPQADARAVAPTVAPPRSAPGPTRQTLPPVASGIDDTPTVSLTDVPSELLERSRELLLRPPVDDPAQVRDYLAATQGELRQRAVEALRQILKDDPSYAPHAELVLETQEELGRGGMGVVHRVLDRRLQRPAALKVLLSGRAGEAEQARFFREARITARLDHPAIPPVYEAGVTAGGDPFLLMKLIQGQPLSQAIREGETSERVLLEALLRVAEGVAYAHEQRVVHRDLKPANVMLGRLGEVLVLDWGLAKDLTGREQDETVSRDAVTQISRGDAQAAGLTQAGAVMGTPGYLPPEQAEDGASVGPPADVFALGAILVEILTGRPPIEGASALNKIYATLEGKVALPRQRRPEVSRELDAIAACALAAEPEARYPDAESFAADLRAFLAGERVSVYSYGPWERIVRLARRHPTALAVTASVLSLVFLVGGLALIWRDQDHAARISGARQGAEASWAALAAIESGQRTTTPALAALQGAQRWHALSGDPAAAVAVLQAARELAEVSLDSEQWDLAAHAWMQAQAQGVLSTADSKAELEAVEAARSAEARRRANEVKGWLARCERGELQAVSDGLGDAVFAIARYAEPQIVELLAAYLERVADDLHEAEAACLRATAVSDQAALDRALALRRVLPLGRRLPEAEWRALWEAVLLAASGDPPRLDEGQSPSATAPVGAAQREALGEGRLAAARVAAQALGRIGIASARVVDALMGQLRAEADPIRAVAPGQALARLERGDLAQASLHRFGLNGAYAAQVGRIVQKISPSVDEGAGRDQPHTALEWLRRGLARRTQGDLKGAIEDYTHALELDPGYVAAWGNRGTAKDAQGDLEGAIADFTCALELNPGLAGVWSNRGSAKAGQGDLKGAIADCTRALELDSESALFWTNRGCAREKQGDLAGAIADHTRALDLDPASVRAWTNRAHAKRELGDPKGAQEDCTRALELDPGRVEALCERGLAKQAQGDLAGAIGDYTRALELDPRDAVAWTYLGLAKSAQGDLAGAIADYTRAIEFDPNYAAAWANRGLVKDTQRDLEGAIADHTRALALDPGSAGVWSNRGLAKHEAGDLAGAIADHTRALELDPRYAGAWTNRGSVKQAQGDLAGAIADHTRAQELDPGLVWGWVNRGHARREAGDLAGAIADFSRALELNPNDALVWGHRGAAKAVQGDFPGAIADCTRALELDPGHASAWSDRGVSRRELGDLGGAIADLTRALELDPDLAAAWGNRGSARQAQGDMRGAIADFTRALELEPELVAAWNNRGNAKLSQGELEGAIADFTRALELGPDLPQAWNNRGNAKQVQGDLNGAVADYTRALELNPGLAAAWSNRGNTRKAQGDQRGAVADFTRALRLVPGLAGVWTDRGNAKQSLGDLAGAIADHTRALDVDPTLARAWTNRGVAKQSQGDLTGAIADCSRALEVDPGFATALGLRGEAKLQLGDKAGARSDLKRFLELAPNHPHAAGIRQRLEQLEGR